MKDITCDVCFNEYKAGTCLPRLLECGHCCCTTCLQRLLSHSKTCMKCRRPLYKMNAESYQVNFALLEMIETIENRSSADQNARKYLKDSVKKIDRALANYDSFFPDVTIQSVKDILNGIRDHLESDPLIRFKQFQKLEDPSNAEFFISKV